MKKEIPEDLKVLRTEVAKMLVAPGIWNTSIAERFDILVDRVVDVEAKHQELIQKIQALRDKLEDFGLGE